MVPRSKFQVRECWTQKDWWTSVVRNVWAGAQGWGPQPLSPSSVGYTNVALVSGVVDDSSSSGD